MNAEQRKAARKTEQGEYLEVGGKSLAGKKRMELSLKVVG
jgi:hypothetical protein